MVEKNETLEERLSKMTTLEQVKAEAMALASAGKKVQESLDQKVADLKQINTELSAARQQRDDLDSKLVQAGKDIAASDEKAAKLEEDKANLQKNLNEAVGLNKTIGEGVRETLESLAERQNQLVEEIAAASQERVSLMGQLNEKTKTLEMALEGKGDAESATLIANTDRDKWKKKTRKWRGWFIGAAAVIAMIIGVVLYNAREAVFHFVMEIGSAPTEEVKPSETPAAEKSTDVAVATTPSPTIETPAVIEQPATEEPAVVPSTPKTSSGHPGVKRESRSEMLRKNPCPNLAKEDSCPWYNLGGKKTK